ncbi:DUF4350 domain-containing protein [bacterium]|nr:DUF4350 domain-containing protein [bacterium]
MKRLNRWFWIGLFAMTILVLLSLVIPPLSNPITRGSTFSRSPDGYGAWYAYMQQQGVQIQRWQRPPEVLWEAEASEPMTLLQVMPELVIEVEPEWEDWVRRGNTLIVLGARKLVTSVAFSTMQSSDRGAVQIDTRRRHSLYSGEEQLLGDRAATVTCPKSCDRGGNTECDRTVTYGEAVDCLLAAINSAREQGKSTRFEVIDQLMRAYPGYDYHGASSVVKEDGSNFLSFSTFIAAAEADGKVQVHTLAGFKELFLIEEDPIAESEFSPQNADTIDSEQWLVIIDRIQQAFRDGRPGPTFGRFQVLFGYIRQAKKSGELPHSNGLLKKALIQLTEIGVLIEQEDGSFRLSDRWEEEKSSILERLTQMQLG